MDKRRWYQSIAEAFREWAKKYRWGLIVFATIVILVAAGLIAWLAREMRALMLWHTIEAFALGTTVFSVYFGLFLFVKDALDEESSDRKKVFVSSAIIFIWVTVFGYLCLLFIKLEIWHAMFFTLIFAGLLVYELILLARLDDRQSAVGRKLDEVRKYCDCPATFAFSMVVAFLVCMRLWEDTKIGMLGEVDIVPAIASGAFGVHALLTSFIAIGQFSRTEESFRIATPSTVRSGDRYSGASPT